MIKSSLLEVFSCLPLLRFLTSRYIPQLRVYFSIFHFLDKMSDNIVNLVSDSESDTYYVPRIRISLDSDLPHINHDHLENIVISSSDDSDSKRVSRDSLEENDFFI